MIKKGTKIYSISKRKCPHCQEGEFFVSHPYDLKNIGKIHDNCPVCEVKYSPEPGFYYGAMYVSYGIGVGVFVAVFILTYLLFPNPTTITYTVIMGIVMLVLGPFIYELSKIIWANMFIKYKKDKK